MRWFFYLFMMLCLYLFCGCRAKYIPVESVYRDSLIIEKLLKDSIYVRDSIYVHDRGDTIYKYKDKYIYVIREVTDTMYIYRDRNVGVPYPVERKLSWWERLKIDMGGWVMLIVVIALTMRLFKWMARRLRKE